MIKISLIVPVLNEEQTIAHFYNTVRDYQPLCDYAVEIVFIDDGSTDKTAAIITALAEKDSLVKGLYFTRNFGKEAALFAGLEHATGQAVIPMDVDLQDPVEVIPEMLSHWQSGAKVVLAKRQSRNNDTFLKRKTAEWFYKVHNRLSKPTLEENVGDFRLLDSVVVKDIIKLSERNLFMKGVFSWVGYEAAIVTYERPVRMAGKTKFNSWRLWNLALEGITSFSTAPLKFSTYLGVFIALLSFFYMGFLIFDKLVNDNPVPGYPSLMVSILFLGAIQLIAIGILGEYIGRIYIETKQRPRYLLKKSEQQKQEP